jgi:hypothetical protein
MHRAPIHYVPEQDPVQSSLAESTVSTNTVKMPGDTKTHVKVWNGQVNNEALLDIFMQVGGLLKRLSYWSAVDEANNALAAANQALVHAQNALKATKKEGSKTQSKVNASDNEKADVLEKKTATAKAVDAAKLQVQEAEEEHAKAVETPFQFYGSNLSQSKQFLWGKNVTKLTVDAPHTNIFGKKREEA